MDDTGEAPLPTGPVGNLKEFALEVPPPVLPELNQTVDSEPEPEQRRTELVCPLCGCKHVRRSPRRGLVSRSFLRTSSSLLQPKRTTGLTEHFGEILGLRTGRWRRSVSRFFLYPRKWLARRRRPWYRTRREMLLYGGGILGFLAFLSLLIWVTGTK
jgi:hypothetical protein